MTKKSAQTIIDESTASKSWALLDCMVRKYGYKKVSEWMNYVKAKYRSVTK